MSQLSKRATVHIGRDTVQKVPVHEAPEEGFRDIIVNLDRTPSYDHVDEVPEVVDIDWTGYEYVGEFEAVSDDGNPIYSFRLKSNS